MPSPLLASLVQQYMAPMSLECLLMELCLLWWVETLSLNRPRATIGYNPHKKNAHKLAHRASKRKNTCLRCMMKELYTPIGFRESKSVLPKNPCRRACKETRNRYLQMMLVDTLSPYVSPEDSCVSL